MLEEDIRAGIVDKKMTVSRVIDERLLKLAQQELRTEGNCAPNRENLVAHKIL